jgi:hypothetical protein
MAARRLPSRRPAQPAAAVHITTRRRSTQKTRCRRRSGTSQLADIFGEHPQIHRIPIETHFIVDPGGLRDLADALTIRYDPYVGDDALRRLSDILTVRLAGRRDTDRGYTVPVAIGERHYWDAVGRLWPELVASTLEVRAEDLAANWPGQRRALFELLGVDDFATRSTF